MIGCIYGTVSTAIALLGARELARVADAELWQFFPYLVVAVCWPLMLVGLVVAKASELCYRLGLRALRRR